MADAVTNASADPIEVTALAPDASAAGLRYTGAVTGAGRDQQIAWQGAPGEEAGMVAAYGLRPFAPTVIQPGATESRWMLRFEVTAKPSPDLTTSGLRVTYSRGGVPRTQVLNQELVLTG